jgi:hypothetical protein
MNFCTVVFLLKLTKRLQSRPGLIKQRKFIVFAAKIKDPFGALKWFNTKATKSANEIWSVNKWTVLLVVISVIALPGAQQSDRQTP